MCRALRIRRALTIMTSEQIQQLRRDEAMMMAEWSASFVQPCCFNTDGIVDYERWAALPDGKHIVVLRNARCEYAASKSSGEVLDIRAGKDSARDRTIIKTARNI